MIDPFGDVKAAIDGMFPLKWSPGLYEESLALLRRIIRSWRTCDRVRIGMVRTNEAVLPFWTHLGFKPTAEVKPYRYGSVVSETVVLEKRLANTSWESTVA